MGELWEFILAVFSHWQAYVTGGGITAVLQVWERLTGYCLSKKTYAFLVMVGFLLVAFFLAWSDKNQALQSTIKDKTEMNRQLSEVKKIPRPQLEGIRFIMELVSQSPYQDTPYGIKIVVQTNIAIQPFSLRVKCNVPLKREEADLMTGEITSRGEGISQNDPNIFQYVLDFPAFLPETPLVIKLWSDQPITACHKET